ncbi:hypothetical protein D3C71_2205950 [compost metagenome]
MNRLVRKNRTNTTVITGFKEVPQPLQSGAWASSVPGRVRASLEKLDGNDRNVVDVGGICRLRGHRHWR